MYKYNVYYENVRGLGVFDAPLLPLSPQVNPSLSHLSLSLLSPSAFFVLESCARACVCARVALCCMYVYIKKNWDEEPRSGRIYFDSGP